VIEACTMHRSVITRAAFLGVIAASAALVSQAQAQSDAGTTAGDYPNHPVHIIVPVAPGGGADILARMIAQKLGEAWRQSAVVENRSGGNAIIATDAVAKSKPDGYTILFATAVHTINPTLYAKLPYDGAKDFAPVTLLTEYPFTVVIHPSLPVKSVQELIALAKAKPGQLSYASPGTGSGPHLGVELLMSMTGISMVHVPYRGFGEATVDLISGQVQLFFSSLLGSLPYVKSGKLRVIAVTSAKRSPMLPDVPTVAETLPGYQATGWFGLMMPTGTPRPIVAKVYGDSAKVLQLPDVNKRLVSESFMPVGSTPQQFSDFLAEDSKVWAKVIKAAGVKVQ
jgi:tripartite-type tricarboxylate transporter receptor subunit TctC